MKFNHIINHINSKSNKDIVNDLKEIGILNENDQLDEKYQARHKIENEFSFLKKEIIKELKKDNYIEEILNNINSLIKTFCNKNNIDLQDQ